ncbi:MAG TPA: DHA2 family efflux MFS transporter permease subunit, partial [Tepidisphaeraceae bacterium]|nr:DHA2 family efflux MFS transporter permease subunit [Tepidisphaeraceae bacterium]
MSSAAATPHSLALRQTGIRTVSPWLVAVAVVIPAFMEVLDTTIANVALRYIAGGLSAPVTDSEWVITSYLAANAIILPISGWLGAHLGRRNYFLLSIGTFTFASAMCGLSTSLNMLIGCRILQGLAGGGLQPSSQGVLLDAFPPEKQGTAMTMFGLAALLAPVVGPTLGGWLTDNWGWRWIFYINLPVGIVAMVLCRFLVHDPEYINQARAKLRGQPLNFDFIGLGLLSATMTCWEIVLSKGQEWNWFGDVFYRIQILSAIFAVCLTSLIIRELRIKNPLINFRTLKERNFRSCCLIIFCAYGVLYANTTSLPALLQTLFGYDATTSGLVLSPSGGGAIVMLLIVGVLLARGMDARFPIAMGLLVLGLGNYWLSQLNLDISPWQVVWPRVVIIAGLSMLFAPLNVAAFIYTPPEFRGAAVGLMALLRNEGGSVGTSVAQTIQERREQFHNLRLNEHLNLLTPAVNQAFFNGQQFFLQHVPDVVDAKRLTLQV